MKSILSRLSFKGCQQQAATDSSQAIVVTAGAGSGKTRTLVGRYLHLLEQGYPLRSLVAITFTDKAAREMRSRIRSEIEAHLADPLLMGERPGLALSHSPEPAEWKVKGVRDWESVFAELDSARIGTIHSLCAEILRAHPAEAGVDPGFTVLEEGIAAALKARAVDTSMVWAVSEPAVVGVFGFFKENELRRSLTGLLNRRLDLVPFLKNATSLEDWASALATWLDKRLSASAWMEPMDNLAALRAQTPDDNLEAARRQVLERWDDYQQARAGRDWEAALSALGALRKAISTQGRRENWDAGDLETTRECMKALRGYHESQIAPLLGNNTAVNWALDERMSVLLPAIFALATKALEEYQRLKDERQALDFDDLEGLTANLLTEHEEMRHLWQSETRAVLVDEFQDTNQRQRQIVYVLSGFEPTSSGVQTGKLFIVGDAKQSIYRFRGADVTVFRQVQTDIGAVDGLPINLDLTFRAHMLLLKALNRLLPPILGEIDDPARPYQVPFVPLEAYRQSAAWEAIREPYVEFHVGLGEDAESGRAAAANALAHRLCQVREEEGFDWGQIALLFRASTAFEVYEAALEAAGIPYVTVAGRGFYDRPEIRDLLNALTAISDPSDDLALAGLLRSPAIGLSDADLYRLRFPANDGHAYPIWESFVEAATRDPVHAHARHVISDLHALAGRALVSEVLKRFLDLTGYRAILGTVSEGKRMQRNVDKLLADAHRSRLVGLGEFLEYIQTLRDVGLREGEAPVEAGGAVQLMTVHKAKGLEFPLVVIADAAYEYRGAAGTVLLDESLGLLLCLRDNQARPVTWRLANLEEAAREAAEEKRLLYVAATRAREKLIISGHARVTARGKLSLKGWLGDLGQVIQLDQVKIEGIITAPRVIDAYTPGGHPPIGCVLHPPAAPTPAHVAAPVLDSLPIQFTSVPDLVAPLALPGAEEVDDKDRDRESDPPKRVWRVVSKAKRPSGPAWVVGKLVHEALRRWRFPDAGFEDFIRPFALEAGLTDLGEIRTTILEVQRLLDRFRAHPLCAEIEAAERHHEVPYVLPEERGVIDILYRTEEGWLLADFKTDEVRSEAEARDTIRREEYDKQVQRYAEAVATQLGQRPRSMIVFLRVGGKVGVFE